MQNKLVHAAFMMEGLHEAGYDACVQKWDQGCIEMVSALVAYVPYVEALMEISTSMYPDHFPGVFDYEVVAPFGRWFGEHIRAHGDEPSEADAKEWLRREVEAFFCQGLNKEEVELLNGAFAAFSLPAPEGKSI